MVLISPNVIKVGCLIDRKFRLGNSMGQRHKIFLLLFRQFMWKFLTIVSLSTLPGSLSRIQGRPRELGGHLLGQPFQGSR